MLMKNFTLKSLLSAAVLSVALIACSKKEEDAPKTLTADESKEVMDVESERLDQIVEDYQDEVEEAKMALYTLYLYGDYEGSDSEDYYDGISYDVIPNTYNITGFSGFDNTRKQKKTLLNPLTTLSKKSVNGKIIPLDFDDAKGTWELTLITTTSRPDVDTYCSDYVYSSNSGNSSYIYKFLAFKQTSTAGDKIVIRFPSKVYYYSSDVCNIQSSSDLENDIEYTIAEYKTAKFTSYVCKDGEGDDVNNELLSSFKAILKKDGDEIASYDISRTKETTTTKIKLANYTLETTSSSNKVYSVNQTLKNGTKTIFSINGKSEFVEAISEDNICDLFDNDESLYGDFILKLEQNVTYGNLTFKGGTDFVKALEYADDENIDSDSDIDDIEDFYNEFAKYEVFNNAGSKIGIIKYSLTRSQGISSPNAYIEFSDGDEEKISKYSKYIKNVYDISGLYQILAYN